MTRIRTNVLILANGVIFIRQAIYICRYDFEINPNGKRKCKWLLTPNESYAREIDQDYHLASLQDLHDWIAATGARFNGILSVTNGLCKWYEFTSIDEHGFEDFWSGYELVLDNTMSQ